LLPGTWRWVGSDSAYTSGGGHCWHSTENQAKRSREEVLFYFSGNIQYLAHEAHYPVKYPWAEPVNISTRSLRSWRKILFGTAQWGYSSGLVTQLVQQLRPILNIWCKMWTRGGGTAEPLAWAFGPPPSLELPTHRHARFRVVVGWGEVGWVAKFFPALVLYPLFLMERNSL
jgi:hypothetical protein